MNALSTTQNGPDGIVRALIETLHQEEVELTQLGLHFERQLDAIREQQHEQQEQSMHEASETIGTLGQLQVKRERQMRLLGRILKVEDEQTSLQELAVALAGHPGLQTSGGELLTARAVVQERAQQTRYICEQLDFALQYAVSLGRDMIQAMQDLDTPPPPCVYTAKGHTSRAASPHSLVNKVG